MLAIILALSLTLNSAIDTSTMNINQVYQLLLNNGANQQEAATLAGISVWEAGGGNPNSINPQAKNPVAPDYSIGLFQYNFRYPGGFNPSNPMASTRGGYSAQQLMDDVNAQAQSALALLRGSGHNYATQWSTYIPHLSSIQNFVSQLLNGQGPTVTDTVPDTTISTPTEGNTGLQPTTGVQATTGASSNTSPASGVNLGFGDSIQHIIFQLLFVLLAVALLFGGIYLLGSKA